VNKSISVLVASLLITLLMASAALAHPEHTTHEETTALGTLAPSGGFNILLPAAALLLGGGVLSYAILRRV
jgi:hypothetical protein